MKVKCPKCRLRFEVPTDKGITEVQCYCPRCGTPFTYSQTEEDTENNKLAEWSTNAETEHKDTTEDSPKAEIGNSGKSQKEDKKRTADKDSSKSDASISVNQDKTTESDEKEENGDADGDNMHKYYEERLLDVRGPMVLRDEYKNHSSRHVYRLIGGIIAMLLLVALFAKGIDLFVGHFTDRDQEMSEKLAVDSSLLAKDNAKIKENIKEKKLKEKKLKEEKKKQEELLARKKAAEEAKMAKTEALPQWLQGRWHMYTAKEGTIRIHIVGSTITVSDGKHSNTGTAHVRGNLLVCKYHDGRTFTYNLNMRTHHITLEFGSEMTKEK